MPKQNIEKQDIETIHPEKRWRLQLSELRANTIFWFFFAYLVGQNLRYGEYHLNVYNSWTHRSLF
jgi:hypothetical protein